MQRDDTCRVTVEIHVRVPVTIRRSLPRVAAFHCSRTTPLLQSPPSHIPILQPHGQALATAKNPAALESMARGRVRDIFGLECLIVWGGGDRSLMGITSVRMPLLALPRGQGRR